MQISGPKIAQGVSIPDASPSRAPSDEQIKRQAIRDARSAATTKVDVPGSTMNSPESDLQVNLPGGQMDYTDPAKFRQGLEARGYGDEWRKLEKDELEIAEKGEQVKNAQLDTHLKHLTLATQALYAGDEKLALTIANRVEPEGQKIKGFKVIDKDNFIVFSEDAPGGTKLSRMEVDGLAMDAGKRTDKYFPLRYEAVGDKIVAVQRHMRSGKEDMSFSVDNPLAKNKDRKFTPFEQEMQQQAVKMYVESIADDKKADAKLGRIEDATKSFLSFYSGGGRTGVKYAVGVAPWDTKAQELDRKFKALNLDEMVAMFQGMSRAVDSDAERAFFEQKQANVANQDETNAQILVGAYALSAKQLADNVAKRQWINDHAEDAAPLKGFTSPVLGKKTVLFSDKGETLVVDKDKAAPLLEKGYLGADAYAAAMLKGARPEPKIPKPEQTDEEYEYRTLPDGTKQRRKKK